VLRAKAGTKERRAKMALLALRVPLVLKELLAPREI
jgi:hypothetical protein